MEEITLIKLGGSVITDKRNEYTLRKSDLSRLIKEIKSGSKRYKGKIIVGHGAGSFAHTPASKYRTKEGIINKNSLIGASIVEHAARRLNMLVMDNFISDGIPAMPFSALSFAVSDSKVGSKSYLDAVMVALSVGFIPVVYGDVIMDAKTGVTIFSTEKIFNILVKKLKGLYKVRMIYCTDVDGVYDEKGKTIPSINSENFAQIKKSLIGAKGKDVTGGMLHKVEEALKLARECKIKTMIINGLVKGRLKDALLKKEVVSTVIS